MAEHQALIYACACCRRVTKAAFPAGVVSPVQYGPRIRAAAVYLSAQQLIPEDRLGDIMHELFGAGRLCPTSICAWSGDCQKFRVRAGIMGKKEPQYVPTQRAYDTQ